MRTGQTNLSEVIVEPFLGHTAIRSGIKHSVVCRVASLAPSVGDTNQTIIRTRLTNVEDSILERTERTTQSASEVVEKVARVATGTEVFVEA